MIQTYTQPNSLEEIFNQVNNKPAIQPVQPTQPTIPDYNNPFSQNSFINKTNFLGPAANSTPMLPPLNNAGVVATRLPTNVPVAQPVAPISPVVKPTVVGTNTVATNPVTTTPITTPTTVAPAAVPGSTQDAIVKAGLYNDYLTPQERQALSDIQAYQTSVATQVLDPNAEFQNSLKNYQQQIDSINSMYSDRINQARIQGQGRIESRQFAQGRSGQIGSGVGEAGVNAVQNANTQVENSIRSEQANAIADVYSKVRAGDETSLAAKTLAKQQGADALVKHLSEKPGKIKEATASAVAELLSRGVDIANMTPEKITSFTSGLGVSKEQLMSEFKAQGKILETAKKEKDLNQRKLTAEVKNLETKQDWEAAQKALDREMEQKKINVDWYKAETERIKEKSSSSKTDTLTNVQLQQQLFPMLTSPAFKALDDTQKKDYIMSQGGNPSDYGF